VPVSFSLTEDQLALIDKIRDSTDSKSRTDVIMEGIELLYEEIKTNEDFARGFGINFKRGA